MSKICKLCINAKRDDVVNALKEKFLISGHEYLLSTTGRSLTSIERDSFQANTDFPPTLSCTQATAETVEIHFNSFSKMSELAAWLSVAMDEFVVVNIYQSTASAGYWSYHLMGDLLREIEFGDAELSINTGIKFGFEEDQIGHNIADYDEEDFYVFDSDDMDYYNMKLGLGVEVYQPCESEWVNFKIANNQENDKAIAEITQKSWWKFW